MKEKLTNMDRYNIERQEQAEKRKQMVLDVAEKLFLEKGLANTTMNDIMTAARVSKATLYRYFQSIDPIAFEIQYRMIREVFKNAIILIEEGIKVDEFVLKSLLMLIDEFHQHEKEYRYIGMFDNLYSEKYPSQKLANEYREFLESFNKGMIEKFRADHKDYNKLVTSMNVVFSFLQRLATRGKQLEKYQGITVDEQLIEFKKMIEREFSYE
jgi:AcrR family transcriptional regulator